MFLPKMTPLEFLYHFRDLLRERDIRFAITSGMACVYYGLQQNTKDSDWIIEPADLPKLRKLLLDHERRVPPWRISYRQIFGAPLLEEYLAAGWTSHLSIWPTACGPEEHVDIFGAPPRVLPGTVAADELGFAGPDLVAWMKRTDRDKDWPIIDGLAGILAGANDPGAVLHMQSAPQLRAAWQALDAATKQRSLAHRPLLAQIADQPDDEVLQGLIALERTIWETVNQERYRRFQQEWKEFYRRWKKEDLWEWPTGEPFSRQHERIVNAARKYELPPVVLDEAAKDAAWERGIGRAILRSGRPEAMVRAVTPPRRRMLP
jgi:hypothetical protein